MGLILYPTLLQKPRVLWCWGKPKEEGVKTALDAKYGAELLLPGFIYSLGIH